MKNTRRSKTKCLRGDETWDNDRWGQMGKWVMSSFKIEEQVKLSKQRQPHSRQIVEKIRQITAISPILSSRTASIARQYSTVSSRRNRLSHPRCSLHVEIQPLKSPTRQVTLYFLACDRCSHLIVPDASECLGNSRPHSAVVDSEYGGHLDWRDV